VRILLSPEVKKEAHSLVADSQSYWSVAHNAKRALEQSTVQDSPLSLGESFKMYSKLYSNSGESFKLSPDLGESFEHKQKNVTVLLCQTILPQNSPLF